MVTTGCILRSGQSVHEGQEYRECVYLMPGYKLYGGQEEGLYDPRLRWVYGGQNKVSRRSRQGVYDGQDWATKVCIWCLLKSGRGVYESQNFIAMVGV